jgi:hypothetical protein
MATQQQSASAEAPPASTNQDTSRTAILAKEL